MPANSSAPPSVAPPARPARPVLTLASFSITRPSTGHSLHLEQPETVADHLGFLNSGPSSNHPELERLTEP